MPTQIDPWLDYRTGYSDKHLIMDGDAFQVMLNFLECSPCITFDFETSGLAWFKKSESCGLALAGWDPNAGGRIHNFYIPYRHATGEKQLDLGIIHPGIKQLLENPHKTKLAHNLKFDLHFARKEGWQVQGPFYDTMLAARLWDENRRIGLKVRAAQDLGRTDADEWENKLNVEVLKRARSNKIGVTEYRERYGYSQIHIPLCGTYACFDVEFTTLLYTLYESGGLSRAYPRIWSTEMTLVEALCDMEEMGLPIDVAYLEQLQESLRGVQAGLIDQIDGMLGRHINLGSDDEVRDLLFSLGCKLTKKTQKGSLSVDREVLTDFIHVHPSIKFIMDWRDAEKLASTYTQSILDRLDSRNLLHPDFQQVGTNTGRLSCREPNFQNQPSDNNDRALAHCGKSLEDGGYDPWSIRRAYINRGPGWVRLFYDYSQIELRVLAFYSRDPIMVDAYLKGEDIHARTSQEVFGTTEKAKRRFAKIINFGLSYGMTEHGFARQAKVPLDEAERYLAIFFQRYHGIETFRNAFWNQIRSQKCRFQNLFGRPRFLPGLNSNDKWERGQAERRAIATLIQGTAAELTKEAIVRIWRIFKEEKLPAHLVSTVHDEIQADCQTEVLALVGKRMKEAMEDFSEFAPIPIVVDGDWSTTNWAEKKPIPS